MHGLGKIIIAGAGLALAAAASPASAAMTLDVNWNTGCSKATCFNDQGVFTQTWSAGSFTGPVDIGSFLMDRGILGSLDGKTFRVSFSVDGQELGTWGSYNMAGINGDTLGVDGADFVWDPSQGDLTLTLELIPPPKPGGLFFAASAFTPGGGDGTTSNNDENSNDPPPGGDQQPNDIQTTAVPEPQAWALMIAGFGLAGAAVRQRRRLAA